MRLGLGLALLSGCSFEPGAKPQPTEVDADVDAPPRTPVSCQDIRGASRVATIEIDTVPTEVYCDLDIDGGGWTLIATLVNDDGVRSWSTLPEFQEPGPIFGALDARDTADYKSPAYGTLRGNDLLVVTDEYSFSFHAVLGGEPFSTFMTSSWPTACSGTWLREGASFTQGLTNEQATLLGLSLRARDPNENVCFPYEESSAIAFMAGDLQTNGLGNAPIALPGWGSLDVSLPNLANFAAVPCVGAYPCNAAGVKKPWDDFGAAVRSRRAAIFVR